MRWVMAEPRLFNIPSGVPFLSTLAKSLVAGAFGAVHDPADPASLARATIFLPTRRAARALATCLADELGASALLLPRIVPLGDVDEAETALIGAGNLELHAEQPIDPLARRLLLTHLVDSWGRTVNRQHLKLDASEPGIVPATLSQAFDLAGDLAALLDQLQTEGVDLGRLETLDAARFDRLWQLNAEFLGILGGAWPAILTERGATDPVTWRNRMLEAEAARLAEGGARGPVIAAGSTGSIPATAALLGVIARLPNGAVVLPGLDRGLPESVWRMVAQSPSHPQSALHGLMQRIGVGREQVVDLGTPEPGLAARADLLRTALLPAEATAGWEDARTAEAGAALADLAVVAAPDERGEALAIALALRETLEEPGATAALVTPDRGLAERVSVELARWGVEADDSAGMPLARAPAGAFLRLVLAAALAGPSPAALAPLMAHPLFRLGLPVETARRGAAALEIGCWRGAFVAPGLDGLKAALGGMAALREGSHVPRARKRLRAEDDNAAARVLDGIAHAFGPLLAALGDDEPRFAAVATACRVTLAQLSADEQGRALAFCGEDGEVLAGLFDDLAAAETVALVGGTPRDLSAMLEALLAERVGRRTAPVHPRLKIWGLLEARLLEADHIVLGGLVEGGWPPQVETDSFVNRPMRAELGLSPPERRIGQTAHDFVQAALARRVTLTRARKAGEAETIPSRLWQRLQAVTDPAAWAEAEQRGQRFVDWAAALSAAAKAKPARRPNPRPPAEVQPVRYSVTEVETLYRDPYQIFARRILELDELPGLLVDPGGAERGSLLHGILDRFGRTYPQQLPADAYGQLIRMGEAAFAQFGDTPEVRAFWWPRFLMMAGHYLAWEERRRPEIARIVVEQTTASDFTLPDGAPLRLSGKADRVEVTREPRLRIFDFKSGAVPSKKQVEAGFAPQLTLEAELAARAGFGEGVPPAPVELVRYVKLGHTADDWKDEGAMKLDEPLADVAARHLQNLLTHLAVLRAGKDGFVSRRAPQYIRYASPYDQLARVGEWSAAPGGVDTGEAP